MTETNNNNAHRCWIFRGNVVIPTGNPFFEQTTTTTSPSQTDEKMDCLWLGPGLKILRNHILVVKNGIIDLLCPIEDFESDDIVISSLMEAEEQLCHVVELSSREFLCPGMIDLHIHAPQYSYTGTATDRPLMGPEGWLETYTFPAERRLGRDRRLARDVYKQVVQTTLRNGTTTAVYFATLDLEPCKILVDTALQYGQRALVGKVCMDRNSPRDYCQSLEQNLNETKDLINYIYENAGRHTSDSSQMPLVLPLITPRFIPTCTPALLSALGEQAAQHNCHITSHISESDDEVAFSRHLDANEDRKDGVGRTDTKIFESHGLLTDRSIMAHGVHLSEDDLDVMKEKGAAVAHCPLSNFFFAGRSLPCRRLLERGNKVGLGTDVAGGYSPSLWNASRMAVVASLSLHHQALAQNSKKDNVLDYRHAFYLATLGGAQALGLEERIGTFGLGMEFDAFILSADVASSPVQIFEQDTMADVFQKLCVLGDDRNVKRVFVQGREVTTNGN